MAPLGGNMFLLQNEASAAVGTPVGVFSLDALVGQMQLASATQPTWIAADANNVYWTDVRPGSSGNSDTFIMKVASSGGTPVTLATQPSSQVLSNVPFGITVDANNVYWTTTTFNTTSGTPATNTMTISQVPISGGAVTTLATSSSLSNPVSDGANVYFGDQATLSTVPVNGGTVTALATQQNVSKVAIDSTNVYWIDTGGGTLTRYPRLR